MQPAKSDGPIRVPKSARGVLAGAVATASSTPVDVGALSFPIAPGETWTFEFHVFTQSSAGLGHRWALNIPAGSTVMANVRGSRALVTAIIADDITADDTLGATFGTGVYAAGGWVDVCGVVINGATEGNVQLRFAAATGLDTATAKTGSYFEARRIEIS